MDRIYQGRATAMSYLEVIRRWRALPAEQQLKLRWAAIPQQVADSMAFEGEPVDPAWLTQLHPPTPPPAGSKPAGASSVLGAREFGKGVWD